MGKRLARLFVAGVLIGAITCSASLGRAQVLDPLVDREISLYLKRSKDNVSKPISSNLVRLRSHKVAVTDGDTIQALLEISGVYYDTSSLSVVYDLNPGVEDAGAIKKGMELVLPLAVGGDALQKERGDGYLVAFALDDNIKRVLLENCARLNELGISFAKLKPDETVNPDNTAAAKIAIGTILDSLEIIRKVVKGNLRPLSKDSISQLRDETDLTIGIFAGALSSGGKEISNQDLAAVNHIKDDLNLKILSFTDIKGPNEIPGRQRDVRVIVRILPNGSPPSRIYYIGEALFGNKKYKPKLFSTIGSQTEQKIDEGDYMIWAGSAVDAAMTSEPVLVNVRKLQMIDGALGRGFYLDIMIK